MKQDFDPTSIPFYARIAARREQRGQPAKPPRLLRVRVSMVLEVDAEQWALEYGIGVREVREDVKSYVCHWAEQTPVPMRLISTNQKTP